MWEWLCRRPEGSERKSSLGAPLMQDADINSPRLSPVAEAVTRASCGSRTMAGVKRAASSAAACLSSQCTQRFAIGGLAFMNLAGSLRNFLGSKGFFQQDAGAGEGVSYALAVLAVLPSVATLMYNSAEFVGEKAPKLYREFVQSRRQAENVSPMPIPRGVFPKLNYYIVVLVNAAKPYTPFIIVIGAFTCSSLAASVLGQMSNTAFDNTVGPQIANEAISNAVRESFYYPTLGANFIGYGAQCLGLAATAGIIVKNLSPAKMHEKYAPWVVPAYIGKAVLSAGIIAVSGLGVYSNAVNGEDAAQNLDSNGERLTYGLASAAPFFAMNMVSIAEWTGFVEAKDSNTGSGLPRFMYVAGCSSLAALGSVSTIYFTFLAEQEKMNGGSDPALSWTIVACSGICAFLPRYTNSVKFVNAVRKQLALCFARTKQPESASPTRRGLELPGAVAPTARAPGINKF